MTGHCNRLGWGHGTYRVVGKSSALDTNCRRMDYMYWMEEREGERVRGKQMKEEEKRKI